jgi:hypothetical protein
MDKKIGGVGLVAVALVLFLIWKDPNGTAGLVSGFVQAVGDFLGAFWSKLSDFVTALAK